jgi:hypothetical protein
VTSADAISGSEKQALRSWRKAEDMRLRKVSGIEMAPIRFIKRNQMTALEHRESCALHVPELGMGAYA